MRFDILPYLALLATGANAALQYKGVDWSSVIVEEKAGVQYKFADGKVGKLENILAASGVNTVRQRIWVNPSGGNYGLAYNIELAKRAKVAGLGVYLNFHYSDTWADPAHQTLPGGWPSDIESLTNKLYEYTKQVCNEFQNNGLQPKIISIGNEITAGLLWPTGRTSNFYNVARLLHSAAWGVKDSTLNPKPQIMIHLDNGWKWETQQWWWSSVLKAGPLLDSDFDIIGVSYYPFYNNAATLGNLKYSLANIASNWGRYAIQVVETNWPLSCSNPAHVFPSDARNIPFSAEGQRTWLKQVASIVSGTKNGNGLFYWEPAWVHNAGLGSSCGSNIMVSTSGQALSSLAVFKEI